MKIKKEVIIGIVAALSIVLLVWGINFLKGKNLLKSYREFYAVYDRIDGLATANPIMINGFKIGQVSDIYFHPDNSGRIIVKFDISDNNIQIPKNTIARIVSVDLLGSKAIEFSLGKNTVYLKDKDTLVSDIQKTLQEQVNVEVLPLKNKAEELLSSIDSVMVVVQSVFNEDARENISKSLSSIQKTIKNFEHTSFALDTLVQRQKNRLDRIFENIESITFNIKNNNRQINDIINNFSNISDSLAKANIGETVKQANKALADAAVILEQIKNGKGSVGLLLNNDTLYNELESSSRNLDLLLEDVRLNPNRYIHFSIFGKTKPYTSPTESNVKNKRRKKNEVK